MGAASDEGRRGAAVRIGAVLVAVAIALATAEVLLAAFAPVYLSTIGRRDSAKAELYGWGYDAGDPIRLRDPDTGRAIFERANDHGWRDRERAFGKPVGALRVLALGDSNTFGPLVTQQATWTAVLESRLRDAGCRVEVLNMAYPGWGTDQQLEALRHEGPRYRPDVVILQFSTNDLTDNLRDPSQPWMKPFYYELEDGELVRHAVEPNAGSHRSWRDRARAVIARSQILTRVYLAYVRATHAARPAYVVDDRSLEHLRYALGLAAGDELLERLARARGGHDDWQSIVRAAGGAADARSLEVVERVLRNETVLDLWSPLQFRPPPPDPDAREWRLLFALLRAAIAEARTLGAEVAILPAHDVGLYRWERYWHRVAPGDRWRSVYLAPLALLRELAAAEGAGFIEPRRVHERARLDSHPNRRGNRNMAINVERYLRDLWAESGGPCGGG